MSGLEVAGVILGAFPIILNIRDYYKEGSQPLLEWLHFERTMVDFIDAIEHQKMQYDWTMHELLKPVVTDRNERELLLSQADSNIWSNAAFVETSRKRLGTQYNRFLRILKQMQENLSKLRAVLGIENDQVKWLGFSAQEHLYRFRISKSRAKHSYIVKLQQGNDKLRQILGCSEDPLTVVEYKSSAPMIILFERLRQEACKVHGALATHWRCVGPACLNHQASLKLTSVADAKTLNLLFTWEDAAKASQQKREVKIQSLASDRKLQPDVMGSTSTVVDLQNQFLERQSRKEQSSLLSRLRSNLKIDDSHMPTANTSKLANARQAHFKDQFHPTGPFRQNLSLIPDLCKSLKDCQNEELGMIRTAENENLSLLGAPKAMTSSTTATLQSLSWLLEANRTDQIEMLREQRFKMASSIACALLQVQRSPWLSRDWTKAEIYFLAGSAQTQSVLSSDPYVSRKYPVVDPDCWDWDEPGDNGNSQSTSRTFDPEVAQTVLFRLGVVILELIFGKAIESTRFYSHYRNKGGLTSDEVERLAAKQWERKVLAEAGDQVQAVVRRCLSCAFEPEPNFKEKRFREAIYHGVVQPLMDFNKSAWP